MEKLLSIITVSNKKSHELNDFLTRLQLIPGFSEIDFQLYLDGENFSKVDIADWNYYCDYRFINHKVCNDFISARNESVNDCRTKYFMILDDDEILPTDGILRMLYDINEFMENPEENYNYIAYNTQKLERFTDYHRGTHIPIKNDIHAKIYYLNDFDYYKSDRVNKVYLWNGCNIFSKELASIVKWKYKGCDDILPITLMYLIGKVLKINIPMSYYSDQHTVASEKTEKQLKQLEENMLLSYKDINDYIDRNLRNKLSSKELVRKALYNSIRQLQVIDKYNPINLIKYYNVNTESKD